MLPFPTRLPGVYFTVESVPRPMTFQGETGTVVAMIPLPWYNEDEPITLTAQEYASNAAYEKLGFTAFTFDSIYNKKASAAFVGASQAILFPQSTGGTRAAGSIGDLSFNAAKLGVAGNNIRVDVSEEDDRFTVITYFGNRELDRQSIAVFSDFQDNGFVTARLSTGGVITEGQVVLENGANGTTQAYSARIGAFLDVAGRIDNWNVIAISMNLNDPNYGQARTAFRNWLDGINAEEQREKRGVIATAIENGIDNHNITQVHQEIELENEWYDMGEAVLYRAGLNAGCPLNIDETNNVMPGMTNIRPILSRRERETADRSGMFTYIRARDGTFRVENDINSFTSVTPTKDEVWRFNRTIRAIDEMKVVITAVFTGSYQGNVDDTPSGRELFHGALNEFGISWETSRIIYGHLLENIVVDQGGRPRTWTVRWDNIGIALGVSVANIHMSITW